MKTLKKLTLLFALVTIHLNLAANPADIPVKDFFKNPTYANFQLSPNGKYLAVLSPINERRNLVVMDTVGLKNVHALTSMKSDVAGFFWANNGEIVFTLDSDGNEAFGLYLVNTKGKPKVKILVGSSAGSSGIKSATVVESLPDDPKHIIVQFNGRKTKAPDLYLLPLKSRWNERKKRNAGMKIIAKNPGDVQNWLLDHDGEVRGAVSIKGIMGKFLYKSKGEKKFRTISEFNILDKGIRPLTFAWDNKTLYVNSNIGRDTNAIYEYDPETNKLGKMIYANDEVDVSGLIMSRKRQKLLGISYFDDYPQSVYFDKETKNFMEMLKKQFPNKKVNVTSSSKDENLMILLVNNDNDPGSYYLFDRKKNSARFLVAGQSWLKPEELSHMKPISFTSRDGLKINGYLTIPRNSNGKNLPLIVNPHGGPFGVRDFWRYNPEHQLFASRGYATVQVNYRGSGGYGYAFEHAGYGGKWGAEMQNDLTDAVKYLVKQGIVNPDKVCIYGGSYGGYATMAGLTFTPELYKCGVNYVGVTDVGLLFKSMPKHWEPLKEVMKIQIGDPEDKELMNRMSPLAHVDQIKAPLMIIQGAKDPRVVKKHALKLRDALEKRGIKLTDDEWIYKLNEGHGFRKEENRIELYEKMDKFLAKYLK